MSTLRFMTLPIMTVLIGLLNQPGSAQANEPSTQTLIWHGTPLSVAIAPGHYRLLIFTDPVRVDVPVEVADQLSVEITRPGYVLLKANTAFTEATLRITRTDGSAVMPLLLRARPGAPSHTLTVLDGFNRPINTHHTPQAQAPSYVSLLRHAAQTLYAPGRLVPDSTHITRTATRQNALATNLIRSERGEHYRYTWLATWSGDQHWISAIRIQNASPLRIRLDPRNVVLSHLDAVSFQHTWLAAAGDLRDETVMYLITRVHPQAVLTP